MNKTPLNSHQRGYIKGVTEGLEAGLNIGDNCSKNYEEMIKILSGIEDIIGQMKEHLPALQRLSENLPENVYEQELCRLSVKIVTEFMCFHDSVSTDNKSSS